MNVELHWYLEEGTIECRNVGLKYFVRIKYCSSIIQISKYLSDAQSLVNNVSCYQKVG